MYAIIKLCLYYIKIQTVHQVTAKGSCHSIVLREASEMEPGMVHDSAPVLIDTFYFIISFATCCPGSTFFFQHACVMNLQVDPALKMDIVEPGAKRTRDVLFQLHPVTLLNS